MIDYRVIGVHVLPLTLGCCKLELGTQFAHVHTLFVALDVCLQYHDIVFHSFQPNALAGPVGNGCSRCTTPHS